jgi:hypothetical protein
LGKDWGYKNNGREYMNCNEVFNSFSQDEEVVEASSRNCRNKFKKSPEQVQKVAETSSKSCQNKFKNPQD